MQGGSLNIFILIKLISSFNLVDSNSYSFYGRIGNFHWLTRLLVFLFLFSLFSPNLDAILFLCCCNIFDHHNKPSPKTHKSITHTAAKLFKTYSCLLRAEMYEQLSKENSLGLEERSKFWVWSRWPLILLIMKISSFDECLFGILVDLYCSYSGVVFIPLLC